MQRTTLTISTESRSYTVQGTNSDIDALFDHLVSETFKPVCNEKVNDEVTEVATVTSEEPVEATSATAEEEHVEEVIENRGCVSSPDEEGEPKKYKGFLLIKCQHCGEVRGFNSRNEISSYKCDCGGETPLGKLIPLTALCECGKRWRYLTNLTQDSYELNCIHCGSPIPVFFNDKKGKKKGGKK